MMMDWCRFLFIATFLMSIVTSIPLATDPCVKGEPVVIGNNTYKTRILITEVGTGSDTVTEPNTNISAHVIGALTASEGGSIFWQSTGDFDYTYGAPDISPLPRYLNTFIMSPGQAPRHLIEGFDVGSYGMKVKTHSEIGDDPNRDTNINRDNLNLTLTNTILPCIRLARHVRCENITIPAV